MTAPAFPPPPSARLLGALDLAELQTLADALDAYHPPATDEARTYSRLAMVASVAAELGARRVDVIAEAESLTARNGKPDTTDRKDPNR